MKINNVELEANFLDADFMEKLENLCKEVGKNAEKSKETLKELKWSEQIREECKIIKDFFDGLFGEGTAYKLFGDKNDLQLCLSSFSQLIEQKNSIQNTLNEQLKKYSPERLKQNEHFDR